DHPVVVRAEVDADLRRELVPGFLGRNPTREQWVDVLLRVFGVAATTGQTPPVEELPVDVDVAGSRFRLAGRVLGQRHGRTQYPEHLRVLQQVVLALEIIE